MANLTYYITTGNLAKYMVFLLLDLKGVWYMVYLPPSLGDIFGYITNLNKIYQRKVGPSAHHRH